METKNKIVHSEGIKRLHELLKREAGESKQVWVERERLIRQYYGTEEYKWLKTILRREHRREVMRKGTFSHREWFAILKSQKNRCRYCQKKFTKDTPPDIFLILDSKPDPLTVLGFTKTRIPAGFGLSAPRSIMEA